MVLRPLVIMFISMKNFPPQSNWIFICGKKQSIESHLNTSFEPFVYCNIWTFPLKGMRNDKKKRKESVAMKILSCWNHKKHFRSHSFTCVLLHERLFAPCRRRYSVNVMVVLTKKFFSLKLFCRNERICDEDVMRKKSLFTYRVPLSSISVKDKQLNLKTSQMFVFIIC